MKIKPQHVILTIVIIIALFIVAIWSLLQGPRIILKKSFGGIDEDLGEHIQLTPDGGYLLLGETKSAPSTARDVYIIKTDMNSNVEWENTYGLEKFNRASFSQSTSDGGYIIAVQGASEEDTSSGTTIHLLKINSAGEEEWTNDYEEGRKNSTDEAHYLLPTPDGGYAIFGKSSALGANGWGFAAVMIKTDADGKKLWHKIYDGERHDVIYSAQPAADGGYMLFGTTRSFKASGQDIYVVKTDADGNNEWQKIYGGAGEDSCVSSQPTADGGYVLFGTSKGVDSPDMYLLKIDAKGNKVWERFYGGAKEDTGSSVKATEDGGFILVGTTESYLLNHTDLQLALLKIVDFIPALKKPLGRFLVTPTVTRLDKDIYVVKTDADGDVEWEMSIHNNGDDIGKSVVQDSNGDYVILGTTNADKATKPDMLLVKVKASASLFRFLRRSSGEGT